MTLLERIALGASNIRGTANHDRLRDWGFESERLLRLVLPKDEIERLVTTPRFMAVATGQTLMPSLINVEVDSAAELWARELADLRTFREDWTRYDELLAVDTNVFLHHHEQFEAIDWHAAAGIPGLENLGIALPMVVNAGGPHPYRVPSTNSTTTSEAKTAGYGVEQG